ncbi:unnamed protein product [Effrenium voratum]|nr:unnamed protein product [Effrenium voratum]
MQARLALLRAASKLQQLAERHHAGHDKDSFLDTLRQDRSCGKDAAGPFVAKNTFRIMTGSNKPAPTNKSCGETGPGARRFLNILNCFPLRWQISAASQAFQFFCWESWKALSFLITRKACYLRNKEGIIWDEEEEQEEEEAEDEPAPKRLLEPLTQGDGADEEILTLRRRRAAQLEPEILKQQMDAGSLALRRWPATVRPEPEEAPRPSERAMRMLARSMLLRGRKTQPFAARAALATAARCAVAALCHSKGGWRGCYITLGFRCGAMLTLSGALADAFVRKGVAMSEFRLLQALKKAIRKAKDAPGIKVHAPGEALPYQRPLHLQLLEGGKDELRPIQLGLEAADALVISLGAFACAQSGGRKMRWAPRGDIHVVEAIAMLQCRSIPVLGAVFGAA